MKTLQRWRYWLLAALAASLAGWFLAPADTKTPLVGSPKRDEWRLDRLNARNEPASTAVLVGSAAYWGLTVASASASAPAELRWRVAAVLGHAGTRSVLIAYPDVPTKEPQILRVGDALPTGERITRIDDRELHVKNGAKARSYLIQPLGPTP